MDSLPWRRPCESTVSCVHSLIGVGSVEVAARIAASAIITATSGLIPATGISKTCSRQPGAALRSTAPTATARRQQTEEVSIRNGSIQIFLHRFKRHTGPLGTIDRVLYSPSNGDADMHAQFRARD